jgi:hypothetical protein
VALFFIIIAWHGMAWHGCGDGVMWAVVWHGIVMLIEVSIKRNGPNKKDTHADGLNQDRG